MDQQTYDAIVSEANQAGLDPAFALAVAERESGFRANAPSSKTINGMFQMTGQERQKWGGNDPNTLDPAGQTRMWGAMVNGELKPTMSNILGRDPTQQELYLGHYFGAGRAARMITGQIGPNTNVGDVFSPYELSINPNIRHAGTVGNLTNSINYDMSSRMERFRNQTDQPSTDPSRYDHYANPAAEVAPATAQNSGWTDYQKSQDALSAGAQSENFTNAPTQGSNPLAGIANAVEGLEGGGDLEGEREAVAGAQEQAAAGQQFANSRINAARSAQQIASQPVALPGNEVPLASLALPTPGRTPTGNMPTVLGQQQ